MSKLNLVAPCLFGIEKIAADEFRRMGFEDITVENGRVLLSGEENMLARANICSHFAERILINVGEFTASSTPNSSQMLFTKVVLPAPILP